MVLVAALSSVAAFKVFSEVYLMAGPDEAARRARTPPSSCSSSAPAPD